MANSLYAYCPECDTRIRFRKRPSLNELLTCPECMEALEVISTRPIELDWAEEDSDDDFDVQTHRNGGRAYAGSEDDDSDTSWEDDWG